MIHMRFRVESRVTCLYFAIKSRFQIKSKREKVHEFHFKLDLHSSSRASCALPADLEFLDNLGLKVGMAPLG